MPFSQLDACEIVISLGISHLACFYSRPVVRIKGIVIFFSVEFFFVLVILCCFNFRIIIVITLSFRFSSLLSSELQFIPFLPCFLTDRFLSLYLLFPPYTYTCTSCEIRIINSATIPSQIHGRCCMAEPALGTDTQQSPLVINPGVFVDS